MKHIIKVLPFALTSIQVSSFQTLFLLPKHHGSDRIVADHFVKRDVMSNVNKLSSTHLHMGFFDDLIGGAFENDPNLSKDKAEGQLEGPNDSDMFDLSSAVEKTDVQKRWLESQTKTAPPKAATRKSNVGNGFGAPMDPDLLPNTRWKLSLYLTGVPSFDPTNSLYGAKTNISNRRDSSLAKDGFAIGADVLPTETSVEFEIIFMQDGVCEVEKSAFTTGKDGQWRLSDDGRSIRFSVDVSGYERTVTTKGTIQNVYWSDREEAERKSSATYEIPPGLVYCEAGIGFGSKPGLFVMAQQEGSSSAPAGILQVEKTTGIFGIRSNMLACGKFAAEMIEQEE